jgi:cytochrome c oxidase assembly protein subunit 15
VFNPALYRFTLLLSGFIFLLIIAGALVTSNDAGLAVPDWPTSFGSLYKIPPMIGGIKYEHGHRMLAEFIGLLTIILAIWTQRSDRRPWMRKLGWLALVLVIVQGVLGGLTVRMFLPWYISTAHAMVAQTFFSLIVLMAIFQGRRWIESEPAQLTPSSGINLRQLSVLATLCVYMQLFLGGAFRHGGMHFYPHLIGAGIATIVLLFTALRTVTGYPTSPRLRAPAFAILGLLIIQLCLGFGAYMTRVVWGKDAPQPLPSMIATTVAHVAVGALLLAHCFMLGAQAFRHIRPAEMTAANERTVTA